ncbi:type VI secretion system-associated protein TagF [Tateyamaria sp. ANG-S1]|uniref:type VI secretion system-associated protein TagF n=1 Tax=Tateyamaria sp. ANG-S1 TaxID=1577905 RepID=UPI00068C7BB4|nr:type VI secretion system-associated protein TagF [Tateyamaria sp. ANG-S1]
MSEGFGAYGKIPALGDFLRSNVGHGFVQAWDAWLQSGMTEVRTALGDQWDDTYLTAPIWRFSLPSGLAGPSAMIGVVMASVDRVGRQFPLTLSAPVKTDDTARLHFANTSVFETLEQIALSMLEDGSTREGLASSLSHVSIHTPTSIALPYSGPTAPQHHLAGQALSAAIGPGQAIWSTDLQSEHRLMATRGLPTGPDLFALFNAGAPMTPSYVHHMIDDQ